MQPELPPCPLWATDDARGHWPEIGRLLLGLNVMALPHTIALVLLVDALADFVRFSAEAKTAKALVAGSSGNEVANPLFALKAGAWDRVLKALREFGMTPSALAGVKALPKEDSGSETTGVARFRLAQ